MYRDLEVMVKTMAVVLPLINELHSPSMQDRHWQTVGRVCGWTGSAPIDPNDAEFRLAGR